MPRFVPRKPELRTCVRRRWGAAVDVMTSLQKVTPVAMVPDGQDGVFVLVHRLAVSGSSRDYELHHISGAGVRTGSGVIGPPALIDAVLVPSAPGTCIAVWANASFGGPLLAQRFDAQCTALWPAAVSLAAAGQGFTALAAVEDGANGAMVAFNRSPGTDFRVQRIDSNGSLLLGPSGAPILDSPSQAPIFRPQFVNVGAGFALLWHAFSASGPRPGTGIWIDGNGDPTSPLFQFAPSTFNFYGGAVRAVPDSQNGFWVSTLAATNDRVNLLRFNPSATTPAVTVTSKPLVHNQAHAIAPDGSGGLFVATVSASGVLASTISTVPERRSGPTRLRANSARSPSPD